MDSPVSRQLDVIIPAFRMHSQSFLHVLEGISEAEGRKRIEGRTNHLIWMAGNFLNVRYGLANVLGIDEKDPFQDLFFMGKALDESYTYPSLATLVENFRDISPALYRALLTVNEERLSEKFPIGMEIPFFEENVLNFIGMCIGREDYLAGQMGLMRRILGHPGMRYDVDENLSY